MRASNCCCYCSMNNEAMATGACKLDDQPASLYAFFILNALSAHSVFIDFRASHALQ